MTARVLVVDDVLPNVKLLAAKLQREYFDVVTAFNGQEALQKVQADAPDIVLLDVMMPGMDGFEVCEKIKSDPQTMHIPVVMVTALSDTSDRVRGLEAGADDFLTKPVNDVALFARVRSLVRLKMTMDEWRLRQNTSGQLGVLMGNANLQEESHEEGYVLVVEDSPLDQDKINETLLRDRHVVRAVERGEEAVSAMQEEDFDLVIVSLALENEDGLRFCSQLRSNERTRHIPILAIADESDLERSAKGLEIGVNDYILKPVDRNELMARVRTQIRRRRYQERLRLNYEESLSLALTDSLTGLFNRRYLLAHLRRLLDRISENKKPLSTLIFDVDHFKQVNDTYGHAVGDEVLRELAQRVANGARSFDLVARIGGEEFAVVLPDSGLETAMMVAERLRKTVEGRPFRVSGPAADLNVTISVGVSFATSPDENPMELMKRADEGLYVAKRSGRNKVCTVEDMATAQQAEAAIAQAGGTDTAAATTES
jgi:two-component system, cell cycle response regulator